MSPFLLMITNPIINHLLNASLLRRLFMTVCCLGGLLLTGELLKLELPVELGRSELSELGRSELPELGSELGRSEQLLLEGIISTNSKFVEPVAVDELNLSHLVALIYYNKALTSKAHYGSEDSVSLTQAGQLHNSKA